MKCLLIILFGAAISCRNSGDATDAIVDLKKPENHSPDYNMAITFINDYLTYFHESNSELTPVQWIDNRKDVTAGFKMNFTGYTLKQTRQTPMPALDLTQFLMHKMPQNA